MIQQDWAGGKIERMGWPMSEEMQLILNEIRGLSEEMKGMESSLKEEMDKREHSLKEDLRQEIRDGDNSIRVILENDIRPKLSILAESHLDLQRKMDELREELRKNELLPARVALLEKDVREIRQQLNMTV
jgi:hypothetical protein